MFYDGYKKAWVLSSYVTRGHFKETLQLSMVTQQSFRKVEFQSTCQKKPLSFITMKIILGNYQCSEVFFLFFSPIGRNYWTINGSGKRLLSKLCPREMEPDIQVKISQLQLTFSTCFAGQFTCNDGQCLTSVA